LTSVQQWQANQAFLDTAIANGDNIVLATRLNQMRAGSFFEREINYLMSRGYTVSSDGGTMLPPVGG
jgi:hypothetical protein